MINQGVCRNTEILFSLFLFPDYLCTAVPCWVLSFSPWYLEKGSKITPEEVGSMVGSVYWTTVQRRQVSLLLQKWLRFLCLNSIYCILFLYLDNISLISSDCSF